MVNKEFKVFHLHLRAAFNSIAKAEKAPLASVVTTRRLMREGIMRSMVDPDGDAYGRAGEKLLAVAVSLGAQP